MPEFGPRGPRREASAEWMMHDQGPDPRNGKADWYFDSLSVDIEDDDRCLSIAEAFSPPCGQRGFPSQMRIWGHLRDVGSRFCTESFVYGD